MNLLPLNQIVTYWMPAASDANGDPSYSAGVAVAARWAIQDDVVRDEKGLDQKTEFAIYCVVDIPKRAKVALGNFNGQASPPTTAREVVATYSSPSMSTLREVLA